MGSYTFEIIRQILPIEIAGTAVTGVKYTWIVASKTTLKNFGVIPTAAESGAATVYAISVNGVEKATVTVANPTALGKEIISATLDLDLAINSKIEVSLKTNNAAATSKVNFILYYQEIP